MSEQTQALTPLNPQLTAFQDKIRTDYTEANKTAKKGQILFVGSSLMEIFPIEKWEEEGKVTFDKYIYNRGVRATTTADLLAHIDTLIFDLAPSKIFINIGSNDIGFGVPEATRLANYDEILQKIKEKLPDCDVYPMAYYPMNTSADFGNSDTEQHSLYDTRNNATFTKASEKVAALAQKYNYQFINVNAGLTDENGNLRAELTFDGAHMYPAGYEIVLENMKKYL
ncbi:SGNH/GDSL hydrolase family protein [Lactococcus nasutitermitis]|uniref:SGNH/GDSL hydrolase family protein n=1 Tax=Lactococcus nasutitermitis TaxID=1652957 RepID=A0ABV9JEQ2_9LACT|nr:SGNH/GDSL hydrolase family protein [Lactococcus nasutitermitis]